MAKLWLFIVFLVLSIISSLPPSLFSFPFTEEWTTIKHPRKVDEVLKIKLSVKTYRHIRENGFQSLNSK